MATWTAVGSSSSSYTLIFNVNQTSQSEANNTSTLSWSIQLKATTSSFSQWGSTVVAKINGVAVCNDYAQRTIAKNTTITIASGITVVPHNTDGSKSAACECKWTQNSTSSYTPGSMSITGVSLPLTSIPRGSVLGAISNFTIGSAVSIPITKYSTSFTDTLVVILGGTTIKTVAGITNNYPLAFTAAECNAVYAALPNATSGAFTFALTTRSGTTTIGTSTKTAKTPLHTLWNPN